MLTGLSSSGKSILAKGNDEKISGGLLCCTVQTTHEKFLLYYTCTLKENYDSKHRVTSQNFPSHLPYIHGEPESSKCNFTNMLKPET